MIDKQSFLENEYVELWIEDGILMERFKPSLREIKIHAAKTIVKDRLIVSAGADRPMLIDVENAISLDRESREYFNSEEAMQYVSACGFVIHSYISWVAAKLFVTMLNPPAFHIEFFRSKGKALEWLEKFKK